MTPAAASRSPAPTGYVGFTAGDVAVVVAAHAEADLRALFASGSGAVTLHDWASRQPAATAMQGRAVAWGTRLPASGLEVVVRHAMHGGLLASLTGDRFLRPGRAPYELEVSQRLRAAGVPTPRLVAHCTYPAGPFFCRSDVATERLPVGDDLPALWSSADTMARAALLAATATLLRALAHCGARHEDLNAKNVYLARAGDTFTAFALDVDRVRFQRAAGARVAERNFARLARSLTKLRVQRGMAITDAEIAALARDAGVPGVLMGAAA